MFMLSLKCVLVVPEVTINAVMYNILLGVNQSAMNVTANKELKLTCEAESYPPALIRWEEIGASGREGTDELTIAVNTTVCGAIINYTCVAENVVSGVSQFVTRSITIYVQGKL